MKERSLVPELMDDPGIDQALHHQALRGLERINRWTFASRILWTPIKNLVQETGHKGAKVLDIATGAGDIPVRLWKEANRLGLNLEVDGCDRSPAAVRYARRRAASQNANVNFFELDALCEKIPSGYDIISSSLFLHHLKNEEAILLLQKISNAAGQMVLVHDLIRHPAGLALAWSGTRLLSSSDVVRLDGPQSVRAAYTPSEVKTLAHDAGLQGVQVFRRFPFRFLLIWKR